MPKNTGYKRKATRKSTPRKTTKTVKVTKRKK